MILFTWRNTWKWLHMTVSKENIVVKVTACARNVQLMQRSVCEFVFEVKCLGRVNSIFPYKQRCVWQVKTSTRTNVMKLLRGITAKMNAVNVELQRAPKWWWSAVSGVSQRSPFKATSFCPHIPHLTTSVSPRSISYSLAHSNIAPLLHAKLTPQVLLYLLTDTCSLKMILSPAANIAAHSGGVLDSIIKLKKRQSEGGWRERRKKRSLTG